MTAPLESPARVRTRNVARRELGSRLPSKALGGLREGPAHHTDEALHSGRLCETRGPQSLREFTDTETRDQQARLQSIHFATCRDEHLLRLRLGELEEPRRDEPRDDCACEVTAPTQRTDFESTTKQAFIL